MVATNKEFQLFHTYKNVSKLEDEGTLLSPSEEHFNVQWYMAVSHKKEDMAVYLHCNILGQTEETWCINAEFEFTLKNSCGKRSTEKTTVKFTNLENIVYGWKKFISWEMLAKDYIIDDIIIAEATVKVTNMTGILKKKLRSFEKSEEEFSDVVLAVEDEKFHVLKKFLASHSTYFNALLLGNFKEAEISEVALKDIDSTDFQNLLEVLYGEPAIDEDTIEGILHLAHMYDMPFPTRKCEEFLIDFSEKPIKEKLKVAKKYQLENLKKSCLMKISTIDEIKAALAGDSTEMDVAVLAALLEKTLTFH
ncbi:BTB domain-containing protein [Caenorhabditis elegans]|uniref:BTB domain-containing protein n=1 Tax=Caenorhabditis elegans TaxID=6239 RepID=Q9N5P9_CAEEL|nr:BTB domain-containing protein [Caenorhabditis elegans]CCD61293.1 BTB domain-containing protein [Caenorhabditis elegans]|eukprot:NP_494157.2 BTB and MATH domain containing [Caenorhabditis elegans]